MRLVPTRLPRLLVPAALLLLIFLAVPVLGAIQDGMVDQGRFTVSVDGRVVGYEEFAFESQGDSIAGYSKVWQFHGEPPQVDTLVKRAAFMVSSFDYGLLTYRSGQSFRGRTVQRGITVYDTVYTSYTQVQMQGEATSYSLPPGKVFLLDPHVFVNFDIICLNLKNRVFETRPITMIVLTPGRDTVITATATFVADEPIRWGGRPVQARHLRLGDGGLTYDMWAGPDGKLMRLEHTATRLKVERDAPPIKRARARTPRKPSG